MKLNVSFRENDATFGAVMSEMQPVTVLDSPAFTGTPTTPTPELNTVNNQIANTEYVALAIALAHTGYGNIVTFSVTEVTS